MKILIVDDNEYKLDDVKDAIIHLIMCDENEIDTASYGNEALCKIKEANTSDEVYDLIILDMQMPELSDSPVETKEGLLIAECLYQRKIETPIIMCSSDIIPYELPENVIGSVLYSPSEPVVYALEEILYENDII